MTKPKRKPGKHALYFKDKHLTKQDHGGTADPNYIAQQYAQGRLPYPENPPLRYGDVSTIDLQKSREILAELDSAYEELPSEARDKFQSPQGYIEWLDENSAKIESDGLRDVLWADLNPDAAEVVEASETASEAEISANAPENGATGDGPPAT